MMKAQTSSLTYAFLGMIWVAVVIIGYFVTHKPINLELVQRLGEIAISLAGALVIVLAAAGLGAKLLNETEFNTPTGAFVQLALGTGILAIVMLALGAAIGVFGWINWVVLVILCFLFRKAIQHWSSSWRVIKDYWLSAVGFERFIGYSLAIAAFITFIIALAPPVKYDALVYHLVFPKMYSEASKISFVPNFFWGMPQLGEMLYTWAFSMAGMKSATVLGWSLNWLAVLGLFSLAVQSLGERPAWVTVVALLSGYSVLASMPSAYVDWLALFFGLATLITLQRWNNSPSGVYLILAGCFTGFAMGCKYSAGVVLIAGSAIIVLKKRSQAMPYLFQYLGLTLLSFSPWVIKNLLATGNPIYPFFFPAGAVDQFRLQFYRIAPERNWQDMVLLPLRATFLGIEGGPGYSTSIGPLLLALSPLALLKKDKPFRLLDQAYWIFTIVGLLVWVIAAQLSGFLIQSRLYFSIFPGIAITAGLGFKQINTARVGTVRVGMIVAALLILVMVLTLIQIGVEAVRSDAGNYLTGRISREEFLEQNLGWYTRAMQAVNDLPEGSRSLMLWEPRSLYCLPKCVPDEIIDRWKRDRLVYQEPNAILERWRSLGYSHLLYYRLGASFVKQDDQRYSAGDWEALDRLLAYLPPPEDFGGAYLLYRLEP